MRKQKRKFLPIEMLVVRKEYQGQGYKRQMLDYAYGIAEQYQVPVILDTDDRNKAARYMKAPDEMRRLHEQFYRWLVQGND